MKYLFLSVLLLTAVAALVPTREQASQQMNSDARAREIIHELKLTVLPKESGYLGIIGVSAQTVTTNGRKLAVQSQNYYMLTRESPINYLHWLEPDDTHILIEGRPVDYFLFHPDGRAEKITLGLDYSAGASPPRRRKLRAHGQHAIARIHSGSRKNRCRPRLVEALHKRRSLGNAGSPAETGWPQLAIAVESRIARYMRSTP